MGKHSYTSFNAFQFRSPVLSTSYYRRFLLTGFPMSGTAASIPDLDLLLSGISNHPIINIALAIGSTSLFAALQGSEKTRASALPKLFNYLNRMSTRSTPYGLFAGVGIGSWGTTVDISIGDRMEIRIQPDLEWLTHLLRLVESDPEVRNSLNVRASPLLVFKDRRIHLVPTYVVGRDTANKAPSIRRTPVVDFFIKRAENWVSWSTLLDEVRDRFSSIPSIEERARELLDILCSMQFITTDIFPGVADLDINNYILSSLGPRFPCNPTISTLSQICVEVESLEKLTSEAPHAPFVNLTNRANSLSTERHRSPFQVTTLFSGSATLPVSIAGEISDAATLLLRLSPYRRGMPYLAEYRCRFVEKYGTNCCVPLLEVIDHTLGIGLPNFGVTLSQNQSDRTIQRERVLLQTAANNIRRPMPIELGEEFVREIEIVDLNEVWPSSLELFCSVASASRNALAKGDYKIIIGENVGYTTAGRAFGRFSSQFSHDRARNIVDAFENDLKCLATEEDEITAEIVCNPSDLRLSNLMLTPQLAEFEIPLAPSAGFPDRPKLPIGDIYLCVRDGKFEIYSGHLCRKVRLINYSPANVDRLPFIARLLYDINEDNTVQLRHFGWGAAEGLSYLPRVQKGRSSSFAWRSGNY